MGCEENVASVAGPSVSEVACSPTRDGGDDARGQVDPADAAVAYVGEVYGVVERTRAEYITGWWGRMV